LPAAPSAVRIQFDRYTFTSREELSDTGRWWRVEPLGASEPRTCSR
jgi:hypothetical protein